MSSDPVVGVKQGSLRGRVATTPSGVNFFSFQGIPYAKPPVGPLKFRDPQPPEPWAGIRDATQEGSVCPQVDPLFERFSYVGDEDCLFLNVYTPNVIESLPVMVWIHGGAFQWGSGNTDLYGPDFLMEKNVVLVTINYRCGVPGFLCLNTPEIPGNAGFKDQIQALRWVKTNIHNFGGDASNITIFGENSGAASVCLLASSPMSKNLISKAIVQSGIGLSRWVFQEDPIKNAKILAKSLKSGAETVEELYEFYTKTALRDLVEASAKINLEHLERDEPLFTLVVEKEFPGVEAAFSEPFINILSSGRTADIPLMVGYVSLEVNLNNKVKDLQRFIPSDLKLEKDSPQSSAVAERIKELYFKGDLNGPESLRGSNLLNSHKVFGIDTHN